MGKSPSAELLSKKTLFANFMADPIFILLFLNQTNYFLIIITVNPARPHDKQISKILLNK